MDHLGANGPPNLALVLKRQVEPPRSWPLRALLTVMAVSRQPIWGILATLEDPAAGRAVLEGWEQFRPITGSDLRGRRRTPDVRKRRRTLVRLILIALLLFALDIAIAYALHHS